MDLRRGISMAVDSVVTNLKGMARMISTSEEIAQVQRSLIYFIYVAFDLHIHSNSLLCIF
jgi:hypothetical protein